MGLFKSVSLKNALTVFKLMYFSRLLLFILPVIILVYQNKGLSVGDFFLIQGIFAITMMLMEIPTGYVGDLFSRKIVILFSALSFVIAYSIFYFCSGFWWILSAEMLLGVGGALYSGTGEAYLYDILQKQELEKRYMKELSLTQTINIVGTAIATVSGGFIYYQFGVDTLLLVQLISILFCIFFILLLPDIDDYRRKVADGLSKWRDILNIVHYASTHHEIKWLMLYPAVFGTATLILMWGLQPLMEVVGIPVALFGVFVGLNQFSRAGFAYISHSVFKKLKTNKLSILLFGVLIIGYLVAILTVDIHSVYFLYPLLAVVAVIPALQVLLKVVTSSMIQYRIKSDERATIVSVNSMFSRFFTGLAMISLKPLFDGVGVQMTFIISMIVLVLAVYPLIKLLRLKLT